MTARGFAMRSVRGKAALEDGRARWLQAMRATALIVLGVALIAPKARAQPQPEVQVVAQRVLIEHIRITSTKPFAEVKAALETKVQRYDERVTSLFRSGNVEGARAELERLASPTGVMLMQTLNLGAGLALNGLRRNAMQYGIGNVITASEMTKYRLAAALYAPIRVVLYEAEGGGAVIEYDRPTSLFGNLKSKEIDVVAARLDEQLQSVFKDVTQ